LTFYILTGVLTDVTKTCCLQYVNSGLRRDVDEICALLRCYAA